MAAVNLSTYDPSWQTKWEDRYETGLELWRRALEEVREYGSMREETREAWRATITERRRIRKRSYATTGDVAKRIFNILSGRAFLAGYKMDAMPDPEGFSSLREIREYFTDKMKDIRQARAMRKRPEVHPMPVLPRGEGPLFNGNEGPEAELITQAFYLPDLDNGLAVVVMAQRFEDETYICVSGKSTPTRLRTLMPQLARLLHERLFSQEDPNTLHFFVHHPLGHGENFTEQFWQYDLRPDARGAFHMAARRQLQMLPYAVANKAFMDGKPERETALIELDKYWPYRAGVEMAVARQERITERGESARALKAARRLGASRKTDRLVLH